MATRFLICPPTHFAINYDINPWMTRNLGYPAPYARRQWERFIETLGCAGDVEFVRVEANEHVPDLVFTSNAGLVCGNLAIVRVFVIPSAVANRGSSAPRSPVRGWRRRTCSKRISKARATRCSTACDRSVTWVTAGASERNATLQLQEIVGCRVLPLLLVDERFYHLHTALCSLNSGHVMVYMDAFSPHAQTLLRRSIDPSFLIEVGVEDALALACNAVEVDDAIVLHECSRGLRDRLIAAGYRIFQTD